MQMAKGLVYEKGCHQVRLHARSVDIGFCLCRGYRKARWDDPPQGPKGFNMEKHL